MDWLQRRDVVLLLRLVASYDAFEPWHPADREVLYAQHDRLQLAVVRRNRYLPS